MTIDDIKQQYSMQDIVERYGMHPDRAGFIHCPFHEGDRTASLKVYKDNFYCFGCHEHGDIFTFVQKMDNCSFRDAFKSLGGESGHLSDAAITRIARQKRKRRDAKKNLENALRNTRNASSELLYFQMIVSELEPYSDMWCDVQNLITLLDRNAEECLNAYFDAISKGA